LRAPHIVSSNVLGFSARVTVPTKLNYEVFSHYSVDLGSRIAPMKTKASNLYPVAGWIAISSSIAVAAYVIDLMLFSSSTIISPSEALFVEGVAFLLIGIMFLLGRGGINYSSKEAAILSATTQAVSGAETVGPAEQMRRDTWKSKGFSRAGIILIVAGVLMLAGYFMSL
jgi:hypothetical protein